MSALQKTISDVLGPSKRKIELKDEKTDKKYKLLPGYKGGGLGKHGTGITEPIPMSTQVGKAGIGFTSSSTVSDYIIEIKPVWLFSFSTTACNGHMFPCKTQDTLKKEIEIAKNQLEKIQNPYAFYRARTRSNPFEKIGKEGFQNRAALKIAELDAICGGLIVDGKTTFADICAGPGGFSEYMFSRLKDVVGDGSTSQSVAVRGYGITLKGKNDFKMTHNNFRAYYGADQTGDVTKTANIIHFSEKIHKKTKNQGVDVVLADGGFDVTGKENDQELLSQQIILCQIAIAISITKKGGVFVCKLFDTFLPFTIHLIHVLYQCFEKISIIKPNQSRPANSERYIVCANFKGDRSVLPTLLDLNKNMVIKEEEYEKDFLDYIYQCNETYGKKQIAALNKLYAYSLDKYLPSDDQDLVRRKCLEFWKVV